MKKATAIFWGIIFVAIGIYMILTQLGAIDNIDIFRWRYIWPAFMILMGVMFHIQFFAGGMKSPGILVPGGILLVYGCLFIYMSVAGWSSAGYLWPIFLVGPGFGLMELRLFSRGREGSWVPVIILFGLALFFFVRESFSSFSMAAAVALIIVGVAIIAAAFFDRKKGKKNGSKVEVDIDMDRTL